MLMQIVNTGMKVSGIHSCMHEEQNHQRERWSNEESEKSRSLKVNFENDDVITAPSDL